MAEEVIQEVGPGGEYLTHKHTLKHFRKEFWVPEFMYRDNMNLWEEKGRPQLNVQLKERAKRILQDHIPSQLPEDVLGMISEILE